MKIQTLEINNFKGLKKFKIENLPDFVVLTGESGAGKSSILYAITYLKTIINRKQRTLLVFKPSSSDNMKYLNDQSNDVVDKGIYYFYGIIIILLVTVISL